MRKLYQLGELGIINKFFQHFSLAASGINLGMGDDAAALEIPKGYMQLITTDIMVEDIHFERKYCAPQFLGHKILAINLSDIAAMGGEPRYFLLSLGFPEDLEVEFLEAFIAGLQQTAKDYNVTLIGGDTSASKKYIILSLTLLGQVKKRELITRSGAKPGDYTYVSGHIGCSAVGLNLLKAGYYLDSGMVFKRGVSIDKDEEKLARQCLLAHLSPSPRLKLGRVLSAKRLARAMIDVSDGISRDLNHICRLSKCGALLYEESLPISEAVHYWAKKLKLSPYDLALHGGEDYELLFTLPPEKAEELEHEIKKNQLISATKIGEIKDQKEGIKIQHLDGTRSMLTDKGYDHFRDS
jgi:thiamine-monophosphate kinase